MMRPIDLLACMAVMLLALSPAHAQTPGAATARKPAPAAKSLAPAAVKAVEERTPVDDDPTIALTEAEIEIARRVHTGTIACEKGVAVTVSPSRREGFFVVMSGSFRYRMHPVESRTGAIRLEDPRRGALWLQLGNKSMLMDQKRGMRIADECKSPEQALLADELRRNPPPSLLESPAGAVGVTTAPAAAEAASAPATPTPASAPR